MIYEETRYGFRYGPAEISRHISDDKKGWVLLGLKTPKFDGTDELQIYITKTGKVVIYGPDKQKITLSPRKKT